MDGVASGTMPSLILAIDTALSATSACLLERDRAEPAAFETMPMERGHAEALVPMIDRVVSRAPGGFGAVFRIAVTVGPGSFTGIRVGVAAARALGLACEVPVVGISTLSVLAAPAMAADPRATVVAAVDARHGNVYVQSFPAAGEAALGPVALPVREAVRALGPGRFRLVGSGASMMAIEAWSLGLDVEVDEKSFLPDILFVARLGLLADPRRAPPTPLYLKPPDATPPTSGRIARVP